MSISSPILAAFARGQRRKEVCKPAVEPLLIHSDDEADCDNSQMHNEEDLKHSISIPSEDEENPILFYADEHHPDNNDEQPVAGRKRRSSQSVTTIRDQKKVVKWMKSWSNQREADIHQHPIKGMMMPLYSEFMYISQ
ncbi:hypothetical protein RCL1_008166 [Eukaryota sp. TZLM3-RCL]